MATLTLYPIGNADTSLIALDNGRRLLFDYADMRDPDEKDERRIDLPAALREALDGATAFEVVAFTHADRDHVLGAAEFFELTYAKSYQGGDRVGIGELWVPAAFITDTDFDTDDARILQKEARHRLRNGSNIKVFGRPEAVADWLADEGLTLAQRRSCFVDAGTLVPGFDLEADGVEFFAHSPFAVHQDEEIIDKNRCSLVLQATFQEGSQTTRVLLTADAPREALNEIVQITRAHDRDERLAWDVVKLPHHCSYLSLSEEKGADQTKPDSDIQWLFEQGTTGAILVSTSWPIPTNDDSTQPPHRQAANYYRHRAAAIQGQFVVTMEHPSRSHPEPLVIEIGRRGAELKRQRITSATYIASRPAPRAG